MVIGMLLSSLLVPSYSQMLSALSSWLTKAQEQMPMEQAEDLLGARLAPDMFPLSTQIRFVCVQAQEMVFRLKGQDLSDTIAVLLTEGHNAGEQPGSLAEAQSRISESIAILDELDQSALDKMEETIALELPNGMSFSLTPEQYVRDWSLPQFYFHLMTAYSLLRANGVALGKVDYVPHMFKYLATDSEQ